MSTEDGSESNESDSDDTDFNTTNNGPIHDLAKDRAPDGYQVSPDGTDYLESQIKKMCEAVVERAAEKADEEQEGKRVTEKHFDKAVSDVFESQEIVYEFLGIMEKFQYELEEAAEKTQIVTPHDTDE